MLYRAWRPRRFDEVIGQDYIVEAIKAAVTNGKESHAYLFYGPAGSGKTTLARLIAMAVNCEAKVDGEPCGSCRPCKIIEAGSAVDVVEIDAASTRGIDEMRALRERVRYVAVELKTKIYIIDEVHMLTNEASNALLKTLEEPPPATMFILATTERHKVIQTIASRCIEHETKPVADEVIAERLQVIASGEGTSIDAEAALLLAQEAHGGVRDAITLLERALCVNQNGIDAAAARESLGRAEERELADAVKAMAEGRVSAVFEYTDALQKNRTDIKGVISGMHRYLRDVCAARCGAGTIEFAIEEEQKTALGPTTCVYAFEEFAGAYKDCRWSIDPRLRLEQAMIRVMRHNSQYGKEA